jgi:hypothetical protein
MRGLHSSLHRSSCGWLSGMSPCFSGIHRSRKRGPNAECFTQISLNGRYPKVLRPAINHADGSCSTGNIIANTGFIQKIGHLTDKGTYILPGNAVAIWGALQSLGQLIGMIFFNPVSDRVGRKMTLYLLWLVLFGVSRRRWTLVVS